MNERKLIANCLKGTNSAQRRLFEHYYKFVYNKIFRYVSNHHDTEDVLVESFNQVFKNLNAFEFRGEGSLKRWICKIAINQSIKAIQKKKPINYIGDHRELERLQQLENEENMDLTNESAKRIMAIVNKMPIGYKTVFMMNILEGYSHQEIADVLGISRNTSKSQMLKARRYIYKELKIKHHGR